MFKKVLFICVLTYSQAQNCNKHGTILAMKKPTYNFSIGFLDRISYGMARHHFVFSPLSTWLQLVLLADGARSKTLDEIWNVTGLRGYRTRTCYRRKFKQILNNLKDDSVIRSSAIILDKSFKVKKLFKSKAEFLSNVTLMSLDFRNNSADKPNDVLKNNNKKSPTFLPEDFGDRVLLMADLAYFKSAWRYPFSKAQTKPAPFFYYSETGYKIDRNVDMMNQVGYFKETEVALINARILELPFENKRLSMLIFLPTKGNILNIYYTLRKTTLTSIIYRLNKEKSKAVHVSLPKFSIKTKISNIPAVLYSMGLKRAFYPEFADFKDITNSGVINVSWMSQVATINVTESHVEATVAANIIRDVPTRFNTNRPFAFMLVNKETELLLFSGIYSHPNEKFQFHYVR